MGGAYISGGQGLLVMEEICVSCVSGWGLCEWVGLVSVGGDFLSNVSVGELMTELMYICICA